VNLQKSIALVTYVIAAFFLSKLSRESFLYLSSLYVLMFGIFLYWIIKSYRSELSQFDIIAVILLCIVFFFSPPNLSEDVYRFIWDGQLAMQGINPYADIPSYYFTSENQISGVLADIYPLLNSPDYYSVYPPVLQIIFEIIARISGQEIFWHIFSMRAVLMFSLIGNLFVVRAIMKNIGIPSAFSLLFFLNPLVLSEIIGNVHFEGLQILWMMISIWFLLKQNIIKAGLFWGLAASIKLLPLLALPLLVRYLGWKKGLLFCGIACSSVMLTFIPYFNAELIINFFNSIDLYFRAFEFNASIYYLMRSIGYWVKGYNWIHFAGPLSAALGLIGILITAQRQQPGNREQLFENLLLSFSIYLFFATTVHPWYLITPMILAIFQKHYFIWVWSFFIIFTYHTYQHETVKESMIVIWIQYFFVYLTILFRKEIGLFVHKIFLKQL
jgi:alpha-1,6-mannosyltransferase